MLDIEQRVTIVEARVADHNQLLVDLRHGLLQFQTQVDRRFEQVDRRLEQVDRRFEQVEAKLTGLDQKFDSKLTSLEQKVDNLGLTLNAALTAQRTDMHGQFRWTAGIILTGLVAIVAALLAR